MLRRNTFLCMLVCGMALSVMPSTAHAELLDPTTKGMVDQETTLNSNDYGDVINLAAPIGGASAAWSRGDLHNPRSFWAPSSGLGRRALILAYREQGQKEMDNVDNAGKAMKYISASGGKAGDPWCSAFVTWVWARTSRGLKIPNGYRMYCGNVWRWGLNKHRAHTIASVASGKYRPHPGDLVLFGQPNQTLVVGQPYPCHHIGIVLDSFVHNGKKYIQTIEGNVPMNGNSVSRNADGVRVSRRWFRIPNSSTQVGHRVFGFVAVGT